MNRPTHKADLLNSTSNPANDLLKKLGIKDSSDALVDEVRDELASTSPSADEMEALQARLQCFAAQEHFKPGMLVTWKPGLRNKRLPRYGQPAIVVEVLPEPLLDLSDSPELPYWREPLDLLLGILDAEGDLLTWHYDSRRFHAIGPR